jgi:hypothetical protein
MGFRFLAAGLALAGVLNMACAHRAGAQSIDNGGTVPSQDSIFQAAPANPTDPEGVLRAAVLAAETNVNLGAAFMHTQYHENLPPGTGDDENGFTGGFSLGAGALVRDGALPGFTDIYTSLADEFSAGGLNYGGHFLASGLPVDATDNAVFNRIEARVGIGFPLVHGVEVIPFIAAGYQMWNRTVRVKGAVGDDEYYHSALVGGGVKLDVPVNPLLVVSVTAEGFGLVAGGLAINSLHSNDGFGPTGEERVSLGFDYNLGHQLHAIASAYWQHFNYSGFKPKPLGGYFYYYEPLSTTTQFGGNVGIAYSF